MKFYAATLLAILMATPTLQACEPLSDHEKTMRRLDKQLAKVKKDLARMERANPESLIKDGRIERSGIRTFVGERDFERATSTYERLLTLDIDNEAFAAEIEQTVLDILERTSDEVLLERIQANTFLSVVAPSNEAYPAEADKYRKAVFENANQTKAKLRAQHDKVEGVTWYYPKTISKDPTAYLYIGTKEDTQPWLRLRAEWDSQFGWLFVERLTAWYDGEKVLLMAGPFERRSTSHVWEWRDVQPTARQIEILANLADGTESLLRFEGAQRHEDHSLSSADKRSIKAMLDAFQALSDAAKVDG